MAVAQITSLKNPRIKQAAKLRDARHREKLGRFLIDGQREIARAVQAGIEIEELFACQSACAELIEQCAANGTHVLDVSPAVFERIAFGDRAEGLLAVAVTPQRTLQDIQLPPNPLVALLESTEKPGNVGAIVRTADAAGVDAVLVVDPATDLYNPNAIRASLGAMFTVPVVAASSTEAAAWLRDQEVRIFAARVDAAMPYSHADYTAATAIVLGSEAVGLTDTWSGPDITAVGLPMAGAVDSLNVSATAAVLLYEAVRQRSVGDHAQTVE